MIHDVPLTQKHKPLLSHFNQESCREHNRCDQQDIFKERNGRRRREGVCDNNADARAKRTHCICPEQTLLEQQVIKLRACASRWTEVCDGIESYKNNDCFKNYHRLSLFLFYLCRVQKRQSFLCNMRD